jgi:hypothetical protein
MSENSHTQFQLVKRRLSVDAAGAVRRRATRVCGTARALRAAWWRRMRIRVTGRARSRMKQKGLGAMADTNFFYCSSSSSVVQSATSRGK